MTSELVEAVARAICQAHGIPPDDGCAWIPDSSGTLRAVQRMWELHERDARAAILATLQGIRKPSDGILAAGYAQLVDCEKCSCGERFRHAYRRAIDSLIASLHPKGEAE